MKILALASECRIYACLKDKVSAFNFYHSHNALRNSISNHKHGHPFTGEVLAYKNVGYHRPESYAQHQIITNGY